MKRFPKVALLAVSMLLVLGLASASEYAYGSKVFPGDSDVGTPLTPFAGLQAARSIGFWDIGVVPGQYDANDIVYLHIGAPPLPLAPAAGGPVRANDIRLTPYGDHPAGSKVTAQDNDIGMPLNCFNGFPNAQIGFLDLYGGNQYDLLDPVLINTQPPFGAGAHAVLNDVRLTESEGMPAGTKLQNSDLDFGKQYAAPIIMPFSNTMPANLIIQYFDVNGNGVYDYPDDVYLHFPAVPANAVKVNDVRLSGPIT